MIFSVETKYIQAALTMLNTNQTLSVESELHFIEHDSRALLCAANGRSGIIVRLNNVPIDQLKECPLHLEPYTPLSPTFLKEEYCDISDNDWTLACGNICAPMMFFKSTTDIKKIFPSAERSREPAQLPIEELARIKKAMDYIEKKSTIIVDYNGEKPAVIYTADPRVIFVIGAFRKSHEDCFYRNLLP